MDKSTQQIYKQLHKIEDDLIQLSGLLQALQQIQPDDSATTCLTTTIKETLSTLQQHFSECWDCLEGKIWV